MSYDAGVVVWCDFNPIIGSEQGGRRPALVIASHDYSEAVTNLTLVVPCTTRQRNWPHHVQLTGPIGMSSVTFAITEQPRTISTARVHDIAGRVDETCLNDICRWVHHWMHPWRQPAS